MKTKVITKKCHVLNAKCQLLQLIIPVYVLLFDEGENQEEALFSLHVHSGSYNFL